MNMRRRSYYTSGEVSEIRWIAGGLLAAVAALVCAGLRWAGVSWHDIGVVESCLSVVLVALYIIDDVRNDRE